MSSVTTGEVDRFHRVVDAPRFPDIEEGYLPDNVFLSFYFTPHVTAEHFDEGADLLVKADIFVPELVAWNENSLRRYNAVSKGNDKAYSDLKQRAEGQEFGSYFLALYKALYRTWKPVFFIDADHTRDDLLIGDFKDTYAKAITSDVETTFDGIADVAARIAGLSLTRDVIMVENLGVATSKLVRGHPKLSKKEEVEVMIALGVSHSAVHNAITTSEDFRDRTRIHHWAGKSVLSAEAKLVDAYKRGAAPTCADLAEFLVKSALVMIHLPTVQKRKTGVYDENAIYSRTTAKEDIIGEEMASIVLGMGADGLDVCRRIILRSSLTRPEMETLRDAYVEASSRIADN